MLSSEAIHRLEIIQPISVKLQHLAFCQSEALWKKHKLHMNFCGIEFGKKYAYTKIGRTLGLQTTRYLSVSRGFLFYFDEALSRDYLGYCDLQNVYLEWFLLKQNRYLLLISNGLDTSLFYFDSSTFWNQQKEDLFQFVIQLNFYNEYYILQQLGEGSFSKVFLVRNKQTGNEYAAKMIQKSDKQKSLNYQFIKDQKKILKLLKNNRYICQFKEFYQQNQNFILLMELVPGRDLMTILKIKQKFSEQQIKQLLINILSGLKECHSQHVIHRDIKPQNIIVDVSDNMNIKIIDFGLSLHYNKSIAIKHRKCGTMGYMAPQIFDCFSVINEKSDVFSFGILAHLVLFGFNPLKGKSHYQTIFNNQQYRLNLKANQIIRQYGQSCWHFIKRLLERSPNDRFSVQQALNCKYLCCTSDKQQSQYSFSTIEEQQMPIIWQN